MKQFIREITAYAKLYRDDETGIAWIENGKSGLGVSVHANIDETGSVEGMKARGWWGHDARTVQSHGWIYNIDTFICDPNNELEMIVANECMCTACQERRSQTHETVQISCSNGTMMALDNLTKAQRSLHSAFLTISEINEGTYISGQEPLSFNVQTSPELATSIRDLAVVYDKLCKAANVQECPSKSV